MSLSIVCFYWKNDKPEKPWRDYSAENVYTLQRMVSRNLTIPHKFVCCTNEKLECETVPLPEYLIPYGNAYPKLSIFKSDAKQIFGTDYILSFDLDVVILDNIDSLITNDAFKTIKEFPAKRPKQRMSAYNSSMVLLRTGSHPEVWNDFDPTIHPKEIEKNPMVGSDQVWLTLKLGKNMPVWTGEDGLHSYKYEIEPKSVFPSKSKIVFFHGKGKPWDEEVQNQSPWIKDFYY